MAVGQAFQDVLEVGERLDAIEFCSGQQRRDGRPARCTAVGTGEEALSMLEHEKFDCMVLDLRLPDMSGFDLLERIRSHHRQNQSMYK